MKIFLVGFMGCGKTTIGKKLARLLNYEFADLDKLIEVKAGMTIQEYFSEYGEEQFRVLEKEVLHSLANRTDLVVATGGGAPCYFDNMEWMNQSGVTVYLSMPPRALAGRLQGSTTRPLLRGLAGESLVEFIANKLKEREPFYNQAQNVVSGIDLTAEKLAGYLSIS